MRNQPVQAAAPLPGYVDVVLPRRLDRSFTYIVPTELRGQIVIGQSVIVPFGTQDLQGVVIALHHRPPSGAPEAGLKSLRSCGETSLDHVLTPAQVELSRWVAERYAAPWGQCIKLVLPPVEQPRRLQARYLPTAHGLADLSTHSGVGEDEMRLLARLRRRPKGIMERTLLQGDTSSSVTALRALVRKGLVVRSDAAVAPTGTRRGKKLVLTTGLSLPMEEAGEASPPLSAEAQSWLMVIDKQVAADGYSALLLEGERATRHWCLVQAAQATLRRGRRVLVVTGDVENAGRLAGVFAAVGEQAMLLHSGLSVKEREAAWQAARVASATIVIGTRMAVFAPIDRLGLVWVEGEDDTSLKEEQVPRYHARDVAQERARRDRAVLVLASNHPSLESWLAVRQGLMMACVYRNPTQGPKIQVIDLKAYGRDSSAGTVLTPPLCEGIRDALQQRLLVVLFLNRKGFASVLHCGDCGAMPQCDVCSVALTFFRHRSQVRCHFCGRAKPVPDHCPRCRSLKLEPVGSGTERIEEAVRRMFPLARVGRVDGETIRRPADARAVRRLLDAGELDIVIGTQMLFRLALQAKAAFVAVPDADAGLHIPDFRSAERMYHGLVDAADLALPATAGGRLLVQTRLPDHHAILALASGKEELFVAQEQAFRQLLQYPPWTSLIRLDVSGTAEPSVARAAHRWVALLRGQVFSAQGAPISGGHGVPQPAGFAGVAGESRQPLILGPSPAPHAMVRGRYCYQILVKADSSEGGRAAVLRTREELERESRQGALRFEIDVDPVSMT
ncbi:replication restart helicase PriA [Nitrospira defluvii]|uniref:Probable replication restart protein PriA n=1 Tax=Nitrospira defluvii TaxID=330214 RepID=A0ABM8QPF1_9BACT|nr:primosomal protein N' [Nitrospira defluvii]CAE6708141.1 putative primosomal protein N\\' [Nitrospira defluvii]